jgi:hypothetical protein
MAMRCKEPVSWSSTSKYCTYNLSVTWKNLTFFNAQILTVTIKGNQNKVEKPENKFSGVTIKNFLINGRKIPVETIPGMGRGENKGE